MNTMCCDERTTDAGTRTISGPCYYPRTDIAESDEAFAIEVELPGVAADQVDLQVEDEVLRLSAKHKRGTYVRTFHLGTLVNREGIEANLKDGVLTIRLPKAAGALPRKITIQ